MLPKPTPTRPALRQMLRAVLPTASDFEAFSGDYFPEAVARFGNNMDRVAKATLLLELAEAQDILAALGKYAPNRLAQYELRLHAPDPTRRNPYRGLAAFNREEAHLFFGREELTAYLWQRFEALFEKSDATRLLAILGPSGSGKSSVAHAGLLAALGRSPVPGPLPMRVASLKPGERPVESLARSLLALLPVDNTELPANRTIAIERLLRNRDAAGEGLRRLAAELPEIGERPVLVLVDQFEEIYTLCSDAIERDLFVGLLLHAAQARSRQVSVVLTVRSDFLGETQRYHPMLSRLIAEQGIIVPALSREELCEAIARPAEQAGRGMDQATVELLLTEVRGRQGALPLLEFALTRIWEGMESGEEPGATLRKLGGVVGALAREAQKIYRSLPGHEQSLARRALVRLVQMGEGTRDTRRRAPVRELCGRDQTIEMVLSVLRRFATESARLVTLSGDGAEAVAELVHEALFEHWQELRQWIDESRADRRFHDRVIEAARLWEESNRQSGRLWRAPDLDLLRAFEKRKGDELSEQQTNFLHASEEQLQSELRHQHRATRQIRLTLGLAILAVLGAVTVWGYQQQERVKDATAQLRLRDQEEGRRLLLAAEPLRALWWLSLAYRFSGHRNGSPSSSPETKPGSV